jgi:hypothetical protein
LNKTLKISKMKNLFNKLFPKQKQKEAEKPDLIEQSLYNLAINPMLLKDNREMTELLIKYGDDIKYVIRDAIEANKERIGYVPFKTTASVSSILFDNADKNDIKYILLKLNIHYVNYPRCKYVVDIPEINPISLDQYLDYYNEGLNCGLIPKGEDNNHE